MIGLADMIVYGTIERVSAKTITIKMLDTVTERFFEGDTLEIVKYTIYDRIGSHGYAPGQTFIWLLSWRSETDIVGTPPQWHIFGAEGEGELPTHDGYVYLRENLLTWLPSEEKEIHGRLRRVQRYDRSLFWDAIVGYRCCFRWVPGIHENTPPPQLICAEKELQTYRAKSPLHEYLVSRTLDGE